MGGEDGIHGAGDFHTFMCRSIVTGELITVTQLHIGSGEKGDIADNPVIRVRFGNEEMPYIPGSSIKGVVRSFLEQVLSEVDNGGHAISYLFGSAGSDFRVRGHVMFTDCHPTAPVVTHLKPGVAIDRDTGSVLGGRNYTMETVAPGSRFSFKLVLDNIDLRDQNSLPARAMVAALREMASGNIALGGRTTTGLGVVRLDIQKVTILTRDAVKKLSFEYEDITSEVPI